MSFGVPVRNGLAVGLLASTFLSSLRIGGRPAMSLNFIGTDSLDSRVTFTRASTATFVGSNGLIQSAAINAPRFDYTPVTLTPRGLLIEEARTNFLVQSEAFDTVAWGKTGSTVSANVGVAPSGATTADKIVEDTSTGVHEVSGTVLGITAGQNYATTFFLKADGRSLVRVMQTWNGTTDRVHADFDLANGTVGAAVITGTAVSASAPVITSLGNGWYRCQISGNCPTGTTLLNYARMMSAAGVVSYTGNGTSGVQIWGGQAEAGAFATSYIPTDALTVARSADIATMTGTNFSSWYNQSRGSFVTDFSRFGFDSAAGSVILVQADDGTTTNRLALRLNSRLSDASAQATIVSGGSVLVNAGAGALTSMANRNVRAAMAYQVGAPAAGRDGSVGDVAAVASLPTVTQLNIGQGSGAFAINGHIRQITYYNTRLTNTTLQALTA